MEQLAYFVFNKKRDYESGYRKGIRITEGGLALEEGVRESGVFISRLLDSGERGNQWHRAVIQSVGSGFIFTAAMMPRLWWTVRFTAGKS